MTSRRDNDSGPGGGTAALVVSGLSVAYGDRAALRGVDLSIAPGEVLGLLGPNGAGKSTLMDAVVGRVRPSAGEVRVFGRPVAADPRAARRQIGYAGQDLAVYPTLTVAENVSDWAAVAGLRGRSRRSTVDSALAAMRLTDLRDRPVRTLSGGEQRRVHCAMAVVGRAPLLLLDEPTVGVDPQTRTAVLEQVARLAAEGTAVCYSTHYLPEVEALGARVVLLHEGRVRAQGSIAELSHRYGRPVVELSFRARPGPDSGTEPASLTVPAGDPTELPQLLLDLGERLSLLDSLAVRRPSLDEVFDRVVHGGPDDLARQRSGHEEGMARGR